MNIQIITSSYPAFPGDPAGTAGLFVRDFAKTLAQQGHTVVVQPVARKAAYQEEEGIVIEPLPWRGGDRELASMAIGDPRNWAIFFNFFLQSKQHARRVNKKYNIDRVLCMWAVPSGWIGAQIKSTTQTPYDVWALGSDIWKIRKIPVFGPRLLRYIFGHADGIYADGMALAQDVEEITGQPCAFLPSTRILPSESNAAPALAPGEATHFLFVGRYHANKGPDLLIKAIPHLSDEIKKKIRVHMFGIGPMEEELKQLLKELNLGDIVQLEGAIDAQGFAAYLTRVAFLVIPSRIESIPLVFSDAIQKGVPVVAMPVGDLPRLVRKFQCGVLATEVHEEALAMAIERAVREGAGAFKAGVDKAGLEFSIEASVQTWLKRSQRT